MRTSYDTRRSSQRTRLAARLQSAGDVLVGDGDGGLVPDGFVVVGQGHYAALLESHGHPVAQLPRADLRPLGIKQHGADPSCVVTSLAQIVQRLLVVLVAARRQSTRSVSE